MQSGSSARALPLFLGLALAGCLPVPVSTVPFHPRVERPAAVQSPSADGNGSYSALAFDGSGEQLAAYDSASDRVRIFRVADLAPIREFKPVRRPWRLRFSPSGAYLAIEAHESWIADHLAGKPAPAGVDIDSPAAIRDGIQRAEVRDLRSGRSFGDLTCDAAAVTPPQGGWLWARRQVIVPGYRTSLLMETGFSDDESVFFAQCWDGTRQRWNLRDGTRLPSQPSPALWSELVGAGTPNRLSGNHPLSVSPDGQIAAVTVRRGGSGFPTTHLWNRASGAARGLPGECATRVLPWAALSRGGGRIALACNKGIGHAFRAWDLASDREMPLAGAEFGLTGGDPVLRAEGIALSPDGRLLAVALLNMAETLVLAPLPAPFGTSRSDLRIWSLDDGRERVSIDIDDLVVDADYHRGVDIAFSPDGGLLALGGRRLRIYRADDLNVRAGRK